MSAQSTYLALILGPLTSIVPGVVECGSHDIAAEMKASVAEVEAVLRELEVAGLVRIDVIHRVIVLPEVLRTAAPTTQLAAESWARGVASMPDCELVRDARDSLSRRIERIGGDVASGWSVGLRQAEIGSIDAAGSEAGEAGAALVAADAQAAGIEATSAELETVQGDALQKWNAAAAWVREQCPRGRRWTTHRNLPQKARGPLCEHVRRLGREEFLAQFSKLLRWAVHQPFWTELRHDGHASDSWVPTIISILAADKWDERIDIAAAAAEIHRTISEEADAEDERERKANEELARILAAEHEKGRAAREYAEKYHGGNLNWMHIDETPITDPELISVTEAAEELIRSRRNGAAS